MTAAKTRIFFLTFYPPTPTMGGAMAFYRHFVERRDFELFVATDDKRVLEYNPTYPVLIFEQPAWLERLTRTRLGLWAHSYKHLVAGNFIPPEVEAAARQFKPDLIFTIAGSWDWTAVMAEKLARKLGVPLVGSFNDWFDFSTLVHPRLHHRLEKRFRSFYQACDLACCTSEGMREELGSHSNAQVLYPIGASRQASGENHAVSRNGKSKFVIAFAGNLGHWYGKMLEPLITVSLNSQSVEFRIFGSNPSWSPEFDKLVREKGIFRGQLPFESLRQEMASVDAALLPMGFGEDCALTERTSFKTKFLDYLCFEKPIVLWGPDYCSAVRYATEFDSAEVCTNAQASECMKTILALAGNPQRQATLVANARRMYEDRFHPDKIHSGLVQKIQITVETFKAGK
jgi:glycosyltransferase involved in cell wall biosynthesis